MKKLILLTLITAQSFAASPLLVRQIASGFVPPEYVFFKSCQIFDDGKVEVISHIRNEPETTTVSEISAQQVLLIDVFLEVAAQGKIESLPVACDAGTDIVNGYRNGKKIIVDEFQDCASHFINQSRTTASLKEWAITYCGF